MAKWLWIVMMLAWCGTMGGCSAFGSGRLQRYDYVRMQMGVRSVVTLYSSNEGAAREAAAAAFDTINAVDDAMSDYRAKSELSELSNRAGERVMWEEGVEVSPMMADVLGTSQRIAQASGGAFDVTVGACVTLWRESRKRGELPSAEDLQAARGSVGRGTLAVEGNRVWLPRAGTRLDLGGIAKGYAVQRAVKTLKERGFASCLVALSGDVAVGEAPPGAKGWRIGLASGREVKGASAEGGVVVLTDGAVSTSGDASQFVEIGGVRYAHIVDPRTGLGATVARSAAVVARGEQAGELADALATAVYLLGEEDSRVLCEQFSVAAVLVENGQATEIDPAGLLRK